MEIGTVDGETALIVRHERNERWRPVYPGRVRATDGVVTHIGDYYACPWIVETATSTAPLDPA